MFRRLFNVASLASLLLCATITAAGVTSYWRAVEFAHNRPTPPMWLIARFWFSVRFQEGYFNVEFDHTGLYGTPWYVPAFWLAMPPIAAGIAIMRRRQRRNAKRGFPVEPKP